MLTPALHEQRMEELVAFTRASLATEFPSPFGSSIYAIESGELVARAYDTVIQDSDPTSHGEVNAIRLATRKLGRLSLAGHVLYSTCEPCPMCMSACLWAEIPLVVYGASTMEDANLFWPQASDLSPRQLVDHMLREPRCEVIPQVCREHCRDLFADCNERMKQGALRLPPHR